MESNQNRPYQNNYNSNKSYIKKPYVKPNYYQTTRYNTNIDYKIKPWYYSWPQNEDDVRTASVEKLLGWWKCLPQPSNERELYIINLVVDECKYRYCNKNN